jgi:AcrR family transcriptional regulator
MFTLSCAIRPTVVTQLADEDAARLRHGPVSPEQAREMQRKRILDAMVYEVGERGLRGVTIAGVSARAGVSRSTFYELFKDLDTCVLAVLRQVASRSTALMAKAFAEEDSWQDGVLAALAALLESLDREPLPARVCLLEMLAGSPEVLEHRAHELAALNPWSTWAASSRAQTANRSSWRPRPRWHR